MKKLMAANWKMYKLRDEAGAVAADLAARLAGVHLYGLARPSLQSAAPRLTRLPAAELELFAQEIHEKTGIRVMVST